MVWAVPTADAVTLGEMGGELYSVTPRDEHHLGDEFVRRGGTVFPPARVANLKQRRPFDQQQSLTQRGFDDDDDDDLAGDLNGPHAVRLAKRALRLLRHFFVDDEQKIVRALVDTAAQVARDVVARAAGDDHEDAAAFLDETTSRGPRQESIATIAWHPTLLLLAVAQRDGIVAFFNVATGAWDGRVLEHHAQQDISSVQWAAFSGGVVAVACRAGVFLWKLSVKNEKHEPELLQVLTHPTKKVFHQVSWSEDGSLLAAFAQDTDSVFIYDMQFQRRSELKCYHQVSSIQWSPTGEYLFVSTASGASLMWETLTWKKEIWDLATGSCAWSSNGRCLLVAPRKGSQMYPYEFRAGPPTISVCMNTPAVDFSESELASLDKSTIEMVGGKIQSLTWDPTSTRVAITYKSTTLGGGAGNEVGALVAIFSVAWTPFLIFTRSGLIRGPQHSGVPRHVGFASSFDKGALLSIAWSSGLVTFHPFYFDQE